jgi:hypothetical protein
MGRHNTPRCAVGLKLRERNDALSLGKKRYAVGSHLAFVPIDRVVPDRRRRPDREDMGEQAAGEGAAEFEAGPPGGREEPLVAGPAPGRHNAGGSQYIGDGPPASGQDGGAEEGHEPE